MKTHNEYFRAVSLSNRKSCPTCRARLEQKEWIWSWGEYHNAKFRRIRYCCKKCFSTTVVTDIKKHTNTCGCSVNLIAKYAPKPKWMNL